MNKIKRIVIFTLFMDILWLTIIIPAFPNLVDFYQTDYFMISLWITLYSLFGLFSTPILWIISDKYWRKPILFISVAVNFLSYIIIALSWNIWIYLIARIISWLAAWNIWTIQSILSDISINHKDRTANFGIFWAIFGIWFIIWPSIWWRLLWYWIKIPFIISAILYALNLIFIIFGLPETNKFLDKTKKASINTIRIFKDMFISKERRYYLVFFVVNLAIMIYQMSFTLYLSKHFGIWWEKSWYIMWLFWIIMVINQGFLLKSFWLKRFTNKKLIAISLFGLTICYWWAFLFNWFIPVIIFIALSWLFQWIFRPIFQDIIIGNREDIWLVNGNISAIVNLANIFWPIIGGYLININISPFWLVALLILTTYIYAKKNIPNYMD